MPEITNGEEVRDNPFSWSIWTKLFVVMVVVIITAQVYMFLSFQHEIHERRHSFCVAENVANHTHRDLWLHPKEGIFAASRLTRRARGQVETSEDRRQEARIRARIIKGFPIRDCEEF